MSEDLFYCTLFLDTTPEYISSRIKKDVCSVYFDKNNNHITEVEFDLLINRYFHDETIVSVALVISKNIIEQCAGRNLLDFGSLLQLVENQIFGEIL